MNLQERLQKLRNSTNNSSQEHIVIIDAMNMFIRSFTVNNTINKYGNHIGGLVGFLNSLSKTIKEQSPTKVFIVFEGNDSSARRKKIYPLYKSKRLNKGIVNQTVFEDPKENDESFHKQLVRLIQYLQDLPIYLFSIERYEADDIIAYLSKRLCLKSKITIVSNDKDYLQLIEPNINVYNPIEKVTYNTQEVFNKHGVYPINFLNYRCILGDISDDIPNIEGLGESTIKKYYPLISQKNQTSLNEIYEYAISKTKNIKKPLSKYTKLIESKEQLEMNYQLMDLHNIELDVYDKDLVDICLQQELNLDSNSFLSKAFEDDIKNHIYAPNVEQWLINNFLKLKK